MKKHYLLIVSIALLYTGSILATTPAKHTGTGFITVSGQNLKTPDGKNFLIRGINLGNWLNPEGYMFLFSDVNSFRLIDQALKELLGTDEINGFWRQFQENYITRDDIRYIRRTGMNSIRLPFHYKLFTRENYMGTNNPDRGFELIDRVVNWCKAERLYVILDMHDAPGGQTGDNIDDSYGYPYLFENKNEQALFCSIWQRIARHYANEPAIIGYDLLNEPIAPYFPNENALNTMLEPVYKMATAAIRKVDKNHIIILGGAQWDGNFTVFSDWKFDRKMMYTCHRYWCDTLQANVQDFVDFRNKTNRPIYMGETGENTDRWVGAYRKLLERNNIGWHFWPFKKMAKPSCMLSVNIPDGWDKITEFTKQDRSSFEKIRKVKPSQEEVRKIIRELIENIQFANCIKNKGYITALGMQP